MSKKKRILLVYFDTRYCYVPLDLGYALAYAKKQNPDAEILITAIRDPKEKYRKNRQQDFENDAAFLSTFDCTDVIFFLDNIVWSGTFYEYLGSGIAPELKKLRPGLKIGFQSYKIRDARSIEVLGKNPKVDFILRGEAEIPLARLVSEEKIEDVPGVSFRCGKEIIVNSEPDLIEDLDQIPSPYLTGIFDSFIEKQISFGRKQFFLTTTRGCPYRCHYCFRSIKFSRVRDFSAERAIAEIKYLKDRGAENIFILDDTFASNEEKLQQMVKSFQQVFPNKEDAPISFVMTRPELLSPKTIELLAKLNVGGIQVGIQSVNPDVQHLITRPRDFDFSIYRMIAKETKKHGVSFSVDTIFGLPGDNLDFFKKTVEFAVSLKPRTIQMKQLYLNPDTLFYENPERYGIEFPKEIFSRHTSFAHATNGWTPEDIKKAFIFTTEIFEREKENLGMKIISEYGGRNNRGDRL